MGKKVVREVDERFLGLLEVRSLLKRAFPSDERIPFLLLLLRSKMRDVEILAYYEGGTLCGVSVTCSDNYVCSIMYLAVSEKQRSKGVGSSVLRYLEKRHKGKIMTADIEVPYAEADNIGQRIKRLRFYEKNGYKHTGMGYSCAGVDYAILCKNGEFNEPLFRMVYDKMFFGMFRPEFVPV